MTDYSNYTYLIFRANPADAESDPWNWTTMPDWMLEPDEEDDLYHITYSFMSSTTDIPYHNVENVSPQLIRDYYAHFQAASPTLQGVVNGILNPTNAYSVLFTDVAPITFEAPTSGRGMIDFGSADDTSGTPSLPGTVLDRMTSQDQGYNANRHGDIFFPHSFQDGATAGSHDYWTVIHELGHALGLKHPDEDQPQQPMSTLTQQFTVMSYSQLDSMEQIQSGEPVYPSGLQLLDIAALQEIYGRNYITRGWDDLETEEVNEANTVYKEGQGFGATTSTPFMYTIWDGGGIDLIDARNYGDAKLHIDLRQGSFSSIGPSADSAYEGTRGTGLADNNLAIAYYAVIEHVIGDGEDTLIGNAWDNILYGMQDDDKIYGDGFSYDGDSGFLEDDPNRPGPDASADGSGDDVLLGGTGDDILYAGRGDDVLHGGFNKSDVSDAHPDWDEAGYFSDFDDIDYEEDGFDTADYSAIIQGQYGNGIVVWIASDGGLTAEVRKLWTGAAWEIDKLYSIEQITGSSWKDQFYGYSVNLNDIVLDGAGGWDRYLFDPRTTSDFARIEDASATNELIIAGITAGSTVSYEWVDGTDYIDVTFADTSSFTVRLDTAAINHGFGVTDVQFAPLEHDYDDLYTDTASFLAWLTSANENTPLDMADEDGKVVGGPMEAGISGADPAYWGDAGNQVDPDTGEIIGHRIGSGVGGNLTSGLSAREVVHKFIVTDFYQYQIGNIHHTEIDYHTFVKEIDLLNVAAEDVRLTYSGPSGDTLTVHIEGIGSFNVPTFVSGKTIEGIGYFNTSFADAIAAADTATLDGANYYIYAGEYIGASPFEVEFTGPIEVTYYFETLKYAGITLQMQEDGLTFTGTSAGEWLYGRDGFADIILGLAGNDNIHANSGDDTLFGGAGWDQLFGGAGDDVYDISPGESPNGANLDILYEYANEGADTLLLHGVDPADLKIWWYAPTPGVLYIQFTEDDVLKITGDYDSSTGFTSYIEHIVFDDDTDWDFSQGLHIINDDTGRFMPGSPGLDILLGGAGNDSLDGFAGADTMAGGAGNDTYQVDTAGDIVTENADEGTDIINSSLTLTLPDNVEKLTLTGTANINGTGNALDNTLTGNSGANVLDGGAGADTMIGGAGDDTYYVDNSSDAVTETSGTDIVYASVTWTMSSGVENLVQTGSGNINGTGNASDNVITGNSGNNTLNGSSGADTLIGGLGDDVYVVDNAGDVATENADEGTDLVQSSVSHTLANNVENLTLTGTGATSGTGNALGNIITGNTGANTLSGEDGDDTLDGGSGADTLYGGAGSDLLLDSTGGDLLDGGAGADSMAGGIGNDTYFVDNAGDAITENAAEGTDEVRSTISYTLGAELENLTLLGSDNIDGTGNSAVNVITGNSGVNTLNGGGGADTLDGGAGADSLIGGLGNDTFIVDNAGDVVAENSGEGTDLIQSSVSYALPDNVENLTLTGSGNINGTGNSAVNTITGNSGDNILDGGAGADSMAGAAGNDTYYVDNTSDVVTETSGTDIAYASATWTMSSGVENLVLTGSGNINGTGNSSANSITGNSGNNTLNGSSGDDTLDGGAGNDWLDGSTGNDSLIGGTGNDTFVVDSASDAVTEYDGEGIDEVRSGVAWTLADYFENLTLTGSGAVNGTGNNADNVITGNSGVNTLSGGDGNDTLTGGSGNDSLTGGNGNDTLDGGAGNDTMTGGLGDDYYIVDSTSDVLTENADEGTDSVQSSVAWTLGNNFENLTLTASVSGTGNAGDNLITGSSGANTLTGNDGNDVLNGMGGNDSLLGGNGNDILDGGAGTDAMQGGAGDDTYYVDATTDTCTEAGSAGTDVVISSVTWTLGSNFENLTLSGSSNINGTGNTQDNVITGNSGVNTLSGSDGADTLYGLGGADSLTGGNGNDTLYGGDGADSMTGGAGADRFVFEAATAFNNVDTVTDFNTGQGDAFDIRDILDGYYNPGTDDITNFAKFEDSGSNTTVSVDRDGTGGAYGWTQIATLTGVTGLTDEAALVANGNLLVS